ncbi:hypothetical protein BDD12DRAFT_873246 [Trichophaea hybrida]|nr:hypothetical protein BDD12DRAFT_873246 [Trichophaea hybrida]
MPPKKRGHVRSQNGISQSWGAAKRLRATNFKGSGGKKKLSKGKRKPRVVMKRGAKTTRWGRGGGALRAKTRPSVVDLLYRRVRAQPDLTKAVTEDIEFEVNKSHWLAVDLTAILTSNTGILQAINHMDRVWVEAFHFKAEWNAITSFRYRAIVCSGKPQAYSVNLMATTADDNCTRIDFLTRKGGQTATDQLWRTGVGAPFENLDGGYNGLGNDPMDGLFAEGSEIVHDTGAITHNVTFGTQVSMFDAKVPIMAWHNVNEWAKKMERGLYFLLFVRAGNGTTSVLLKKGITIDVSYMVI